MGKASRPRQLSDFEAKASIQGVKGSVQKAGLVLGMIRGKTAEQALAELQFSTKRLAVDARKVLLSAISNAENNHQLNPDQLVVKTAFADKAMILKRWRARARGRVGRIEKPRCNMTIIVAEQTKNVEQGA